MIIYLQDHQAHAGKWIYQGYAHAWAFLDHEVRFINNIDEVKEKSNYKLFITDSKLTKENLHIVKNSFKTYLYVQPNSFPDPWGKHPNFQCALNDELVFKINEYKNIIKWTFSSSLLYHNKWTNVYSIPLAFDDINYSYDIPNSFDYDICFIGGIADNGFNEKIQIMKETLNFFLNKKDLKCAFAVNGNISHEQENLILLKSKVALNIHDMYQRKLGLDTNERTFKSLGCTGIIVSDEIKQAKDLFPFSFFNNDLELSYNEVKKICNLDNKSLIDIKKSNQKMILSNHTYISRVKQLLSLQ